MNVGHSHEQQDRYGFLKGHREFVPNRKPTKMELVSYKRDERSKCQLTKKPAFVSHPRPLQPKRCPICRRNCGGGRDPFVSKMNFPSSSARKAPSLSLSKASNISDNASVSSGDKESFCSKDAS